MDKRIQCLIAALGIRKSEFARRLRLSQPFVSELCSGIKSPSDRTVADICREFNVNEQWLRTGNGEMWLKTTKEKELTDFFESLSKEDPGGFRRRLISVLAKLDESQWQLIADMADKLTAETPEPVKDISERLTELQRQNAQLQARVAALEEEEDSVYGGGIAAGKNVG